MKVIVDKEKCQNYGQCCYEAEDVFQLDNDGKLQYLSEVDEIRRSAVQSAADLCPMQAIMIE